MALVVAGVVAVGALAGCAPGGGDTAPTETETVTAEPSTSSAQPSESAGSGTPSATATGQDQAAGSAGAVTRCAASSLTIGSEAGSGGAAGSTVFHLTLENTGKATCTLQGWPGVSFVGGGNGTQIGRAATQDRTTAHPTVTLRPGQTAVAPLKVVRAENYSKADCTPTTPDGFRVYPPGSKQSLFLRDTDYTACKATGFSLLTVQGLVPQGQAAD